MGARRTSRLIASAVAVATFSSITVVPTAVAADDTTFVEEKTTDDTVASTASNSMRTATCWRKTTPAIRRWKNSTQKKTPPSPSPRTP